MTSTSKENQQREATLPKFSIIVIASILFGTLGARAALASNVVVGVNVLGEDQIGDAEQEALAQQLQDNGVQVIRTGLGGKNGRYTSFVIAAHRHGIDSVVIVNPNVGNTQRHMAPADNSLNRPWGATALQDANPEGFSKYFNAELAKLDAAGVPVVAFEIGNELNSSPNNGDFLNPTSGRILTLSDLNNPDDPDGRSVATGYLAYIKILVVAKELRGQSPINKTTPVLTGMQTWWEAPDAPKYSNMTGANMSDSIEFLRQNGADKLVDGYAVHLYSGGTPRSYSQRLDFLGSGLRECKSGGNPKQCWVTEWAFNNANKACPLDDSKRLHLVREERDAYKAFIQQGRIAALLYYSWSEEYVGHHEGPPGVIFRCGALADAGKLALSPF
jgi:hypothetical protein